MNSRLPQLIALLLTAGLANKASASPLDTAIIQYLDRSEQVRAQSSLTDISSGDRWRRLLPREPQFQMSSADDGSSESYSLSLSGPFPGKTIALNQLDRAKYSADRLELSARKYDAAKVILQSYLDCASGKELARLQQNAVDDFRTLSMSLRLLYESGHSTQAEKIGAELQTRQATADLEAARSKAEGVCKKWKDLVTANGKLSEAPHDPEGIPDDLSAEALAAIGTNTADYARGKAQVEMASATNGMRWWNQAPDVTFGAARNHYLYMPASPSGKEWTTTYTVGMTLPIFFIGAESVEAQRIAAQTTIDRSTGELQVLTATADQEDAGREFLRSQKRLRDLRKSDIPLAEALVESTYAAYKSGKLGYSELIQSRKTLIDLRTQEVQMRIASLNARMRCLDSCGKDRQ